MSTILIAPWGQPAQWGNATYITPSGLRIKTCTSLLPTLVELIKNKHRNIKVVIPVLDSLIEEYRGRPRGSICYEKFLELYGSIIKSNYLSYRHLIDDIERLVRLAAREIIEESLEMNKNVISGEEQKRILDIIKFNLHVIVCPAIGSPGGKWRFEGDARDYLAVALIRCYELLKESPPDKIILDLSHGINFMPALTLQLAYMIASVSLLSSKDTRLVRIEAFNTDPFPHDAKEPDLNINLVHRDLVSSITLPPEIPKHIISPRVYISSDVRKKVDELNRIYINAVNGPISSLYYPFPLALSLYCYDNMVDLRNARLIREVFRLWITNVEVKEFVINRPLRLNPEAVYLYLLASTACNTTLSIVKLYDSHRASIRSLKELQSIYEKVNNSLGQIVGWELDKFEDEAAKVSQYLDKGKCIHELSQRGVIGTRIMIAHAGLQKDIVEICKEEDGEMTIRYAYTEPITNGKNLTELLKRAGLLLLKQ